MGTQNNSRRNDARENTSSRGNSDEYARYSRQNYTQHAASLNRAADQGTPTRSVQSAPRARSQSAAQRRAGRQSSALNTPAPPYTSPNGQRNAQRAATYGRNAQTGQRARSGAVSSDIDRYTQKRNQRKRITPAVIVVLLVVLAAAGGGIYYYLNPPHYDVNINGQIYTVDRGTTVADILADGYVSPTPGNLIAIDGSIALEGGGTLYNARVNGQTITDEALVLQKDDIVEVENGSDVDETYTESTEEIPYSTVENSSEYGAIHRYMPGQNGIIKTITGDVSGVKISEQVQDVINKQYVMYNADTKGEKVIALTFDDGPWPETTDAILDILATYGAKATFFTIGNQISSYSDSVKREVAEGHQVCTHTYDHADGSGQGVNITYMSAEEQVWEVTEGMNAITAVTGTDASKVFRAPGGNFYDDAITNLEPYITAEIGWNIDTMDWSLPGTSAIVSAILSATSGDIVLMHDGGGDRTETVEALSIALPQLVAEGYTFVTIDELLAYDLPDGVLE